MQSATIKMFKDEDSFKASLKKSSAGYGAESISGQYMVPEYITLTDEEAFEIYKYSDLVNSVVGRIISDCVKYRPTFVMKNKSQKMRPRHMAQIEFLNAFFNNVNENGEPFDDIRTKFIKELLVLGRGFIEKVSVGSILKELYNLTAIQMKIKFDEHGMIREDRAYEQTGANGKRAYFNKRDIIFKVYDPLAGKVYGEKKLDTLANLIAADILRTTYNANFFVNGAEASGIISLEGMSKLELKKFKEMWRSEFKGAANAHKMAAVNVPVKYVTMALTNKDMEFSEYGKEIKHRVYAVFKMQPFIMGDVDVTMGKLNSGQQMQAYKDGALKPILAKEAQVYTNKILVDGFGIHDLEVSFADVDLVDIETQSGIDHADISDGVLTINEVRARRNLPPVKWGDAPFSHLPGGSQIDPKTGKLISVQATDGGKPKEGKSSGKDSSTTNEEE